MMNVFGAYILLFIFLNDFKKGGRTRVEYVLYHLINFELILIKKNNDYGRYTSCDKWDNQNKKKIHL